MENEAKLEAMRNTVAAGLKDTESRLDLVRTTVTEALDKVRKENEAKLDAIRGTVTQSLDKVRQDNEVKLEQMRQTVDERLQTTLETRLGEKFKAVSEQLAAVHQGLGEMQNLANDVGNLQRTLTNVKTRGGWGEAQLDALLEDFLTPEQYKANVRVIPESSELVEFAIKLPGQDAGTVWLPIDSKFPAGRLLARLRLRPTRRVDRLARGRESEADCFVSLAQSGG